MHVQLSWDTNHSGMLETIISAFSNQQSWLLMSINQTLTIQIQMAMKVMKAILLMMMLLFKHHRDLGGHSTQILKALTASQILKRRFVWQAGSPTSSKQVCNVLIRLSTHQWKHGVRCSLMLFLRRLSFTQINMEWNTAKIGQEYVDRTSPTS